MICNNEVVVSGIGGIFPKAVDLEDFKDLLLENVNTVDKARWGKREINENNLTNNVQEKREVSFDATFFSIHRGQALYLDPMTRMFLEKTFEAVIDAGMNPSELRGKNYAVMIGSSLSEFDRFMNEPISCGLGLTGQARTMMANRVSYWLNVNGTSYSSDANWPSGVQVMKHAIDLVKSGSCDGAIIGCTNFLKHSLVSDMISKFGVLSKDGLTRPFDEKADGYSRSDGVVVLFVQPANVAKRHYATLLHADFMFNGNRDGDYTDYNKESFTKFLKKNYEDTSINPQDIEYLETYGCGIKDVDKLEIEAIEEVFCKNRDKPLKIGSVKTNIGHAEPVSALMSLIKIIVAMETGIIPAHLNYNEPNVNIPALKNKNIEIVTKNKKWNRGLAAINCFGLTSVYGHIIVQANPKTKKLSLEHNIPALLNFSTRTEDGIKEIIEHLKSEQNNEEFNHLVHEAYSKYVPGHIYRGYVLKSNKEKSAFKHFSGDKKPIWFIYSGMGSQWHTMGKDLMKIGIFAKAVNKCHQILKTKGIDLLKIITDDDPTIFENILNSFVGIAAIQIGLTDCLKAIGITPDGLIGHSVGELGCAYADGCLTDEQMILSAYYRGKASLDAELMPGMMAAIGMSYKRLKPFCPETIDIACHNSHESCTISGPASDVEAFVNILQSKHIFARLVNVSNIAYHSRYIRPAAPLLLDYLKKVITHPKKISSKWVSTSIPESNWNTKLAETVSPEYLTNNLLSSVLFEETLPHIPNNAITIEIAPHGILQAILKRGIAPEIINVALTKRNTDCLEFMFNSLGQLFLTGLDFNLSRLYPPVPYPVTAGTKSLCKLIKWEHSDEWNAYNEQVNSHKEKHYEINLNSKKYENLNKHKVDGQIMLPPALYFTLMCEMLERKDTLKYVTFENIVFSNQITTFPEANVNVTIMINEGTGLFEVSHSNKIIVSGKVVVEENYKIPSIQSEIEKDERYTINMDEFYTELNSRGYNYHEAFKCVEKIHFNPNGFSGKIKYNKNWDEAFSAMLQLHLYYSSDCNLDVMVPKYIQKLCLSFEKFEENTTECTANYDVRTGVFNSNIGIHISGLSHSILKRSTKSLSLVNQEFTNYINEVNFEDIQQGFNMFMKLITENTIENKITITEFQQKQINVCTEYIKKYFQHFNHVNYEIINNLSDDTNLTVIYNVDEIENKMLENNGFILLRLLQSQYFYSTNDFNIIGKFNYDNFSFYLLRKPITSPVKILPIEDTSSWKQELKLLSNNLKCRVLLISKFIPEEGIDKFVQDTRKIVNDSRNLRFLFVLNSTLPDTSENNIYYKEFLEKDLLVTVLKNNHLGNYIRTFRSTETTENVVNNSILNAATSNEFAKFCNANYLNIHLKEMTPICDTNSPAEIGVVDYSGVNSKTGCNIMGIAKTNLKECKLIPDPDFVWEVPLHWNLSDAATIPYAYTLAYYTLFEVANITKGDSVLIHAGCTAFGQAALHVAHNYGCDVYTTVATDHQKHILKKLLPDLLEENIMSSEDCKFELQIMMQTKGRGIDVVLNCLPGDRLHASKRCLATFGRFLQLGTIDFKEYNSTGMNIFLKCTSFHAVNTNKLFNQYDVEIKRKLHQMIANDIKCGIVKPIARKIFSENRIDHILRYLKSSKVAEIPILKLHDVNSNIAENTKKSVSKFNENNVYLVYGDMKDSWLYLVEWLVKRGARKVLVAKQTDNHQNYINRYLSLLKRNYNAEILITHCNASTMANARRLLTTANPFKTIISEVFVFASHEEKLIDKQLLKNIDDAFKLENIDYKRMVCFVGRKNDDNIDTNYILSNGKTCNIQWEKEYTIMDILKNMDVLLTKEDHLNITVKNKIVSNEQKKHSTKDESVFLPNNLKTLKQIGATTQDDILISLTTRTPKHVKGSPPMFIVPGLSGIHCNDLLEFVSQLIYPAYAVNIHGINLETVDANKIAEFILKSHKLRTYNLIGVSWGGVLAIELAKVLEKMGKKVNLQIIDGAPKTVQAFTKMFRKNEKFDMSLLKKLLKINDSQSLQDILNNSSNLYKNDYNFIEQSLKVLRNLIEFSNFYKPEANKIVGQTILIRSENCQNDDLGILNEHCVEVRYKVIKGNHRNMLQDKKFIEFVNDNHVYF